MEIKGNTPGFRYERYNGQERKVSLPAFIEGSPLTVIGAKAFLSCKSVEKLTLPHTLEEVEDWGFAHMKRLEEVIFPAKAIRFGKKVFLGCDRLKRICLTGIARETFYEGIPCFLAAVFRFFPEGYEGSLLQDLHMAGDAQGQWKWLAAYDSALMDFIGKEDEDGFEPAFIGWFHVEDVDDQKQVYILKRREDKIFLVFQRLLYPKGMAGDTKAVLHQYLREYTDFIVEIFSRDTVYGRDIRCYRIWRETGGLERRHSEQLMKSITGEEPELRSFLLSCQLEKVCLEKDFFEGLEL